MSKINAFLCVFVFAFFPPISGAEGFTDGVMHALGEELTKQAINLLKNKDPSPDARATKSQNIRLFYDLIVNDNKTPYLKVDALVPNTNVPSQYVNNGKILLNISPGAVRDLSINETTISFSARFGGSIFNIYIPIKAVLAIYSHETGTGISWE